MSAKPTTNSVSRAARHAKILALIDQQQISSQAELALLLAIDGVIVSQGTLSRDLLEIGAVRVRNASGQLVYARPDVDVASDHAALEARLARLTSDVLISAKASGNLVVVKTPAGAAQYLASAIDRVANPMVLGSIAGDDTVLLIAADPDGGEQLVGWLDGLGEDQENLTEENR